MSEQITTAPTQIWTIAGLAPWRSSALAGLAKLSTRLRTWSARRRERQALWELAEENDQHMLMDIGLTREQARHRAAKWFWQT